MWRTSKTQTEIFKNLAQHDTLIVFDTETSGVNPTKDRIIQISAIKYTVPDRKWSEKRMEEVDEINLFIRPFFAISERIEEITGITNEFLDGEREEEVVFSEVYDFFGDEPFVAAYNSLFDTRFLYNMYLRNGKNLKNAVVEDGKFKGLSNEIDVLKMAKDIVDPKEIDNFQLKTVTSYYGLNDGVIYHQAIDDAKVTASLFSTLLYEYKERESATLDSPKKKVKFRNANFWNPYGHKMERIYVNTDRVKVYYDIYSKTWGSKDPHFEEYDLEDLRDQIFIHYNVDSEEEWVKIIKKAS